MSLIEALNPRLHLLSYNENQTKTKLNKGIRCMLTKGRIKDKLLSHPSSYAFCLL